MTVEQSEQLAQRFGERLRELRQAAGLSPRALALRAATTRSAVTAYEAGRLPRWDAAVRLAAALGVPVGSFLVPRSDG